MIDKVAFAGFAEVMMLASLALLLAIADPRVATTPPHNEIVVRGTSLKALEDALDRCVAGGCSVREDVIASVRYAEGLFRSARYQDARRVLQKAIDRDKRGAATEPLVVAALYEATASVARHDGEQAVVAKAVFDRGRVLKEALPADSIDVLRAELDEADIILSRSGAAAGLDRYRDIETRARAANQPAITTAAVLRQAQVQQAVHADAAARRLLDRVIAQDDQLPRGFKLAAYAMKARLPHRSGDDSAEEALRAALAAAPQTTPVLLFAPPPPGTADATGLDYWNFVDNVTRGGDVAGIKWVDVGFAIRPDGSVESVEPLRGNLDKGAISDIQRNVTRRIYAALAPDAGGQYRIERWTLTADYGTPIGSLIRRRSIRPHFETLDVTTQGTRAQPQGTAS